MNLISPARIRYTPLSRKLHLVAFLLPIVTGHPGMAQSTPAAPPDPVAGIVRSLQSHDFAQALRQSDAALKVTPNDPRLWTLQGIAISSQSDRHPELAIAAFQHALKLSPDFLPALEGAAQLEYKQGSDHARPLLAHILALHPSDPTSSAMLGVLDFRARDYKAAALHFDAARPVIADQPETLAAYAISLANLDRPAEAVPLFSRVVELQPANRSARYNLALAQWNAKQPDPALQTLSPLLEASSPDESALTLAADIAESKGETQHALDLLRHAVLTRPEERDAYLDFANLSYSHSSVQVGIDMLNAGLVHLPRDPTLFLARGVLYSQLGKSSEAAADFEMANKLDPKLPFTAVAEGVAASQQHKSAEAIASFRKAAQLHPDDALTQYLLAEALSGEEHPAGSSEANDETRAAVRATELDPRLVAARDLLATIYLRDGNIAGAIEQSRASLKVDPKDQEALYHLVLATRRSGQKDKLPDLLKRLAEARSEAQDAGRQAKNYQLVETK